MKKLYLLAVIVVFTGCGSSSPRFGASEAKSKTHHAKKAAPRFASPEAKEEAAEDDVKVDTEQIVGRMKASSVRSSKKRSKRAASTAAKTSPKQHAAASAQETASESAADDTARTEMAADTSALPLDQQKMMETIAQWLETPYSYGSDGEEAGIDCSAFTREVFEQAANVTLPRSSAEQAEIGERVARNELKFGDLVFFKTRGRTISHVGIYIGDDLFAHASSGSGVTISSLDSTYFNKRYAAARRVLK